MKWIRNYFEGFSKRLLQGNALKKSVIQSRTLIKILFNFPFFIFLFHFNFAPVKLERFFLLSLSNCSRRKIKVLSIFFSACSSIFWVLCENFLSLQSFVGWLCRECSGKIPKYSETWSAFKIFRFENPSHAKEDEFFIFFLHPSRWNIQKSHRSISLPILHFFNKFVGNFRNDLIKNFLSRRLLHDRTNEKSSSHHCA